MHIDGVFRGLVGVGATWVLWLLVGLSVLALAVIFERLAFFRHGDAPETMADGENRPREHARRPGTAH